MQNEAKISCIGFNMGRLITPIILVVLKELVIRRALLAYEILGVGVGFRERVCRRQR